MKARVLITGGLGYIGAHTIVELGKDYEVSIIDNLSNSFVCTLKKLEQITGINYEHLALDVRDTSKLMDIFLKFQPAVVMHFAGSKSVPESIKQPLEYYENNVQGTVSVLKAMDASNCKKIIFSSSATVYGNPEYLPIDEHHSTHPLNPYGRSKLMAENVIQSWCETGADKKAISLRYFNPIGAHHSAKLSESAPQKSTNLMPKLLDSVCSGKDDFTVLGSSYDTCDGSGVRDYIHVVDLAAAHVVALKHFNKFSGHNIYNVGTGKGTSVLELIKSFEIANGLSVKFKIGPNRAGDAPAVWTTPNKIFQDTGWASTKTITEMCKDSWKAHMRFYEEK